MSRCSYWLYPGEECFVAGLEIGFVCSHLDCWFSKCGPWSLRISLLSWPSIDSSWVCNVILMMLDWLGLDCFPFMDSHLKIGLSDLIIGHGNISDCMTSCRHSIPHGSYLSSWFRDPAALCLSMSATLVITKLKVMGTSTSLLNCRYLLWMCIWQILRFSIRFTKDPIWS